MEMRRFSLSMLIGGVVSLIIGGAAPIVAMESAMESAMADPGAVSVIGGAGAPTYEFVVFTVLDGWPFCLMLLGGSLVITGAFGLIFRRTTQAHMSVGTTLVSMALAAVGGVGAWCALMLYVIAAFGEVSRHPVGHPGSLIVGTLALIGAAILVGAYWKLRRAKWSVKGIVIDVVTCLLYLPSFFFLFDYACEWVSGAGR